MKTEEEAHRMRCLDVRTNALLGCVRWSPVKSLWFSFHLVVAVVGGWLTLSWQAVLLSFLFTTLTLCLGHTLGLHRLLIHRSFQCPLWLERLMVHLGTVVGMGGPVQMLYQHDVRDWGQRQAACHAYLTDQAPFWQDAWWQLHCKLELDQPPAFQVEERVAGSRWYQLTQRWWMLQQLPWAVLFYLLGGWGFVIWGISVRIVVSLCGHWLVGWLAHRCGVRSWHLRGHAVQGYNIPALGLLAMGEAWHNNHHAFPGSARLGILPAEPDPGWWALQVLASFGLVWGLRQPEDMPARPEMEAV